MEWPFNYPGDIFETNTFNQLIVLIDDIVDSSIFTPISNN